MSYTHEPRQHCSLRHCRQMMHRQQFFSPKWNGLLLDVTRDGGWSANQADPCNMPSPHATSLLGMVTVFENR